jgi:zinc transport system substrate-binding protein
MMKIPRVMYIIGAVGALVLSLGLFSCGDATPPTDAGPDGVVVVTSSFPLYDFAGTIGGEETEVVLLPPPGLSPHSFEPTPKDIETIESADMFVYSGAGLEPWVEDVLAGIESPELLVVNAAIGVTLMEIGEMAVDEHEGYHEHDGDVDHDVASGPHEEEGMDEEGHDHGHAHGRYDPHYWLDFDNVEIQVNNILEGYEKIDPDRADIYRERAAEYVSALESLDQAYRDALAECPGGEIVSAGHFAFGYLAHRYGLDHRAVFGAFHDAEPSARELVDMVDFITEHDIKYIVAEEMIDPGMARTISEETGAEIMTLNPAGNVSRDQLDGGVTFIDIMEENLEGIKLIMGCE